jgi:hypothetical protein
MIMPQECALTVEIERGAHLFGHSRDRDILTEKHAVRILKIVHDATGKNRPEERLFLTPTRVVL